jgi:hypothetical protein
VNNEFLERKIVFLKEKSHESEIFLHPLSSIFGALSFKHLRFAAAYILFGRKINYIVVLQSVYQEVLWTKDHKKKRVQDSNIYISIEHFMLYKMD